ncbi:hypothetical protein [Sulfuriroseicoccus oceanibius]|uniref:Uncharacterized protein n=1 Tax=Sulfuriroseicoccus oceanibius TaxID=2707525 RepID=A0A6B3L559_9BACT|nr:hypothetical protein [Sulfuriroseicoccus oceanibius]QQL44482.1 hypothetical protein G3M56_011410 [Sulfuriroseicoccus oceanibius]
MSAYTKPITLFGIAIPAVATIVFCIACVVVKSKISAKADEREAAFSQHNALQQQVNKLRSDVQPTSKELDDWYKVLTDDIRPTAAETLKSVESDFTPSQLALTSRQFSPSKPGSLANGARQRSSTVKLAFRGTYLPMQLALQKIETSLPQLALESMTIGRERGYDDLIFNLSYTAWEKETK